MKENLMLLKRKAIELIKSEHLTDADSLARLAPIPARIDALDRQIALILEEQERIERLLNEYLSPAGESRKKIAKVETMPEIELGARRGRKKIRLELNWSQVGQSGGSEVICEHKASETLARFLTRLYQKIGISILQKLSNFRVNRGMLVTKNPSVDYKNASDPTGKPYQYQPIGGSGFFVLTHSSTSEKVMDIEKACRFLGFPIGAVKAEEVDKSYPEY